MDIPALIYDNRVLLALLTGALILAVYYMKSLSYRETVVLAWAKARLAVALNPAAKRRGRPLIRQAHSEDFVRTVPESPRELVARIRPPFTPNLLSTAKYLPTADGGREWAHSQWASYYDGKQTHVYLFRNANGTTDVYAHEEADVRDPQAHTDGEQRHGDASGKFALAYDSE